MWGNTVCENMQIKKMQLDMHINTLNRVYNMHDASRNGSSLRNSEGCLGFRVGRGMVTREITEK